MNHNASVAIAVAAICTAVSMCCIGEGNWKAAQFNYKAETAKACLAAGKNYRESWSVPTCD